MINVVITKEIIEYAEKKLDKIQSNNNVELSKFGSEKHRILVGYIGEKIIMNYLCLKEDADDFNFDLLSILYSYKLG